MAYQECALYGNLVRYLRDRCTERLVELDPASDAETAGAWLDDLIRDWFFTPQHDLHGDAPRDIIWREQKGEPNVVPPDRMDDLFFDDCPVCQAMRDERVSRLIPLHARIWLRGWSDALTHAAFAQAVGWDNELPF
jgi:hypothetical protein